MDFDEELAKLFSEEGAGAELQTEAAGAEPKKSKSKYKKIKKLDVTQSLDNTPEEPGFNFEIEFQNIINEGCFKKYMPGANLESPESIYVRERVLGTFFNEPEEYSEEVENLLKVHLEFPSREELEGRKFSAWTSLKILLRTLRENKGCRKLYNGIQFYRMAIVAKNGMKYYAEKLPNIADKIRGLVRLKVEDELEQIVILDEVLTTFEKRILRVGDYLKSSHRDFEKAHLALALNINSAKEGWSVFSYEEMSEEISEYEFLFFPLKEILRRRVGSKKHPRLIYIKTEPWAWYCLAYVSESGERHWKLDVWLDNLVISLGGVMGRCLSLYENLYNLRFQDREYRAIKKQASGVEEDLLILIKNIRIMSNRKRCSEYLRKHLAKEFLYALTDRDVLDRRTPDTYVFTTYEGITEEVMKKDWDAICKCIYFNYDPFE